MNARPLNVAVIGAGPAGIYASDILSKSGLDVCIDLFKRLLSSTFSAACGSRG